jgi:hypothetical protein
MKTLALNTFHRFATETEFATKDGYDEFLKSLTEGLDLESDYYIAIFGVCATWYRGYAIFKPQSGNRTRSVDIAEMAINQLAEGAIIVHFNPAPTNLMREARNFHEFAYALGSHGLNCLDYCILKDGKLQSFVDTEI